MDTKKKSERIYQRHLEQVAKVNANSRKHKINNAAIAREFHCSREWVRLVIADAAQHQALENEFTPDSLNENREKNNATS